MKKRTVFLLPLFLIMSLYFVFRDSKSKQEIKEYIQNYETDFSKIQLSSTNTLSSYNMKAGVQYGKVGFENGDSVKFWFVSHHYYNDGGCTLYEFSDGDQEYCKGYHCCEVQFPKTFKNKNNFLEFVQEKSD